MTAQVLSWLSNVFAGPVGYNYGTLITLGGVLAVILVIRFIFFFAKLFLYYSNIYGRYFYPLPSRSRQLRQIENQWLQLSEYSWQLQRPRGFVSRVAHYLGSYLRFSASRVLYRIFGR